jgi:large subunit ribosomal protein L29
MKIAEIRELRSDELSDRLGGFYKHMFDLRSQSVTEKLENAKAIRNCRHDIARVKTVIRERQLKGE